MPSRRARQPSRRRPPQPPRAPPPPGRPPPPPAPAGPPPPAPPAAAAEPAGAEAAAATAARRTAHRALALALPLGALGSVLVLFAASKTWTHGTADVAGRGVAVHATGSQTTALPGALALVGLAALVAVF